MFKNDTVFILGAGASWHYGYPTGEGLVDQMLAMAIRFRDHCNARLSSSYVVHEVPAYVESLRDQSKGVTGAREAWALVKNQCEDFINRIQVVRPTMIDYFLGWNASLRPIGTLLIAAVILECEGTFEKTKRNKNRPADGAHYKDNWYRFLTHKLLIECSNASHLLDNKVKFITFNYDTSLENHLLESLNAIDIMTIEKVVDFLQKDRVIHVYGTVRKNLTQTDQIIDPAVVTTLNQNINSTGDPVAHLNRIKKFLDRCYTASQQILTVDPDNKEKNKAEMNQARDWIDKASVVYILGYGFDLNNNRRLALSKLLRLAPKRTKSVMFTNFEDRNTVNKHASRIFFNTYSGFLGASVSGAPAKGNFREKSTRTVYEALELDFETLESILLPDSAV